MMYSETLPRRRIEIGSTEGDYVDDDPSTLCWWQRGNPHSRRSFCRLSSSARWCEDTVGRGAAAVAIPVAAGGSVAVEATL
jgi:hypothetical protein